MLPAHLPPAVRAAVLDAKAALEALYGERLVRLVLYGSHARGEAHADSDVDLLVVLRGPVNTLAEIRQTSALWEPAIARHDVYLSIQPYGEEEFADLHRPFVRNVRHEGVEV